MVLLEYTAEGSKLFPQYVRELNRELLIELLVLKIEFVLQPKKTNSGGSLILTNNNDNGGSYESVVQRSALWNAVLRV